MPDSAQLDKILAIITAANPAPSADPVSACKLGPGASVRGVRQQAIISLAIGILLGCAAGALLQPRQNSTATDKPYNLSVNQRTGRPQLHVKGQPELE